MANVISTYDVYQPAINTGFNANTGVTTLDLLSSQHDYVLFDKTLSVLRALKPGERVYQNTVFYPGGSATPATVAIAAGNALATFSGANLTAVFDLANTAEFVVVVSNNHGGTGRAMTDVRRLVAIVSNSIGLFDQPFTITNSAAVFMKSPVAEYVPGPYEMTVTSASLVDDTTALKSLLVLKNSNANATVRFVNNSIEVITPLVSGTGYSNNEYLVINGYEQVSSLVVGGYAARANIRTDASGNVTAIYLSNIGAGFPNVSVIAGANIVVVNSSSNNITSNTANGTGLTLTTNVGSTLISEHYRRNFGTAIEHGAKFSGTEVVDMIISAMVPDVRIQQPAGTVADVVVTTPYYTVPNSSVLTGRVTKLLNTVSNATFGVVNRAVNTLKPAVGSVPDDSSPVMPSRSNQMVIVDDATGTPPTTPPAAAKITVSQAAASDFTSVRAKAENTKLTFHRYLINNSYAGEHTNHGNAMARHITSKLSFEDRTAEDLVVYLSAYRPPNTDIKVYARIHSASDEEAFDDKDWTLLECTSNSLAYSSNTSKDNYLEYTYGFPQLPNSEYVLDGTVNLEGGNTVVVGIGTAFDNGTSGFETGDLAIAYDPLFPNTNHVVLAVESVTNTSQLVVHTPPASNAAGYKVARVREYAQQAFRSYSNDNVVRYYSTSRAEHDGYDTFQLKLVLLSDKDTIIPRMDDIKAVGVTA